MPQPSGAAEDPTALLQLPQLAEVHLESRISPADLRARAARAAEIAQLRDYLRQRRLDRLRANPSVQAGIEKLAQQARDRMREQREREEAAEAATRQAAAAAAHAVASDAQAVSGVDQRFQMRQAWLTPQMWSKVVAAWGLDEQDPSHANQLRAIHTACLYHEVGRHGSERLVDLQEVQRVLEEREATGKLGESCPVCRDGQDSWSNDWGQQQQVQGPPGQKQQQQQEQAGKADAAAAAKARLSVAAAEYVPHKQRESHALSVQAYWVSCSVLHCAASSCCQLPRG